MFKPVTENIRLSRPLARITISGDPGCDGYNAETVMLLEHILAQPADLHLVLGDLVPTGKGPWFGQFEDMARQASAPVYCLPGNHDRGEYDAACGRRDYFVRAPNALFIVLDNSARRFSDETLDFLERTLEREDGAHVFVAFHIPPPNPYVKNSVAPEEWARVSGRLQPHRQRVRAVLCGHVHAAFDYECDGFRVIVTGGAGARLDAVEEGSVVNAHHFYIAAFTEGAWRIEVQELRRPETRAETDVERATRVRAGLEQAFANEAMAEHRYRYYAEQAEREGLPQVARLLRAAADSERHHSRNMFLAAGLGASTRENLERAIETEKEEFAAAYPAAIEEARPLASRRAVNAVECALQAERTHHRLLGVALAAVERGEDLPPQRYFTCTRCGFTVAGDEPPPICPACGTDRFKFVEVQ